MDQLTQHWLDTLCQLVKGVTRAVVFVRAPENDSFLPTASIPDTPADYTEFLAAAQTALDKGGSIALHKDGAARENGEPYNLVASPLLFREEIYGVVVLQLSSRISTKQHVSFQQIEEAGVWLATLIAQRVLIKKNQLVTVVELVASCLEHDNFQAAAIDVVTDLTRRLSCDRVSLGLLYGQQVRVEAISHNAGFDRKSNLVRDIGEAMHEAIDQNSTFIYPQSDDGVLLTRSHEVLLEHNIGAIVTVPIVTGGKVVGAVLAERPADRPFNQETCEHFQHIVSMIGPVLAVRCRDEQWLPLKIKNSVKASLAKLIGPGRIGQKLCLGLAFLTVLFLTFTHADYRITSDALLEAVTQRVIVAPQDGYIAEANVRPGDIIQEGNVLGSLDDKDLKLEQQKWSSRLEQQQREYRDALAKHDRSKVSIIKAQILQSQAQLNLTDTQLARTRLIAPFNGFVVSGDLSQSLGSPVERGQVLFTVAPLVAYRVSLHVDERDISHVKESQTGNLVLAGMPKKKLPFSIEKITPVSTSEEGRNFFRVEAKIKESSSLLRPGMEGVAKITIDQRRLLWIWTHKLIDWWRLTFWSFRP